MARSRASLDIEAIGHIQVFRVLPVHVDESSTLSAATSRPRVSRLPRRRA
jgi:hypothetical protein